MKKIVLTYGLISGLVLAIFTAILWLTHGLDSPLIRDYGMLIGFSSMILAFTAVFFGIRAYREQRGGGAITFGRGLKVGLLIALVTCACYVIGWEIVYWNFIPDFADKYAAMELQKLERKGASPAEISEARVQLENFKKMYANPIINVGLTLMEIFPVGLIMSIISAAILRRSPDARAEATA
jgi:Protein of unknown function (DUF4199)